MSYYRVAKSAVLAKTHPVGRFNSWTLALKSMKKHGSEYHVYGVSLESTEGNTLWKRLK